MQALAHPLPFLPLLLKSLPHLVHLVLLHLVRDGHVRSKSVVLLVHNFRQHSGGNLIDLLEFISVCGGIEEDHPMGEA